ncbi:MAG: HEAT repeat domain-containing protein [Candidatus Omnitrophota bacterium]
MYGYHADIVWMVNAALLIVLIITGVVIFFCVLIKSRIQGARRSRLLGIKKNVYETVMSGKGVSEGAPSSVCPINVTPEQFIDVETNRARYAAFFNEAEIAFLKKCFVSPGQTAKLEKRAKSSWNKWQRVEAILCLGYSQAPSAVDILAKLVSSKDEDISYYSIVALGQIKTVHSAKVLMDHLRKDPSSGYKIALVFDGFPDEASDNIIQLTNDPREDVKRWALVLLSKFPVGGYVKKLETLTHEAAPEVRAAACDCLGKALRREAKPAILRCLKDDSWLVKRHAIMALEKLMGDDALPEITGFVDDASWSVSGAVAEVMASHIEAALPYLAKFLVSDNVVAKRFAALALEDSGYLTKLLKDVISGKANAKASGVLEGIVRSGFHSGLEAAIAPLEGPERAKAIKVLSGIDGKTAQNLHKAP